MNHLGREGLILLVLTVSACSGQPAIGGTSNGGADTGGSSPASTGGESSSVGGSSTLGGASAAAGDSAIGGGSGGNVPTGGSSGGDQTTGGSFGAAGASTTGGTSDDSTGGASIGGNSSTGGTSSTGTGGAQSVVTCDVPLPDGGSCSSPGYTYCGGTACCPAGNPYYCAAQNMCSSTQSGAEGVCQGHCSGTPVCAGTSSSTCTSTACVWTYINTSCMLPGCAGLCATLRSCLGLTYATCAGALGCQWTT